MKYLHGDKWGKNIHSKHIENQVFIDNFSFHTSIHGFSDLDCGRNAETCDGTLEKEKDGICVMFDDSLIFEKDEENMYSRVDPMLSLFLQADHDIKCHIQMVSLCDNIFKYCASFL